MNGDKKGKLLVSAGELIDDKKAKKYIDKVGEETRRHQQGTLSIDSEVDRIYLDCSEELVIVDDLLQRRIRIARQGSNSAVVWNPWAEKGAAFGDMGEQGYRNMLCVETCNAASDTISLQPGKSFTQFSRYAVEPL